MMVDYLLGDYIYIYIVEIDNNTWLIGNILSMAISGTDWLEVPTIYKAFF